MTEFVFKTLASIGFTHPLHPPATHLVMGMVMGLFLFGIASYFLKIPELSRTAFHCSVLALIGAFPVILLGYLDWQHSYSGEWLLPIKIKMVLAGLLIVLLSASIKVGYKEKAVSVVRLILYVLCMAAATGLGFFGGQLVYG